MSSLIGLYWLQLKRGLAKPEQNKKTPLIMFVALTAFVLLQLTAVANMDERSIALAGWGIMVIFTLYTAFGVLSNRLPGRMEDIIWMYSAPFRVSTVAYATVLWLVLLRGGLWLLAAGISDALRALWGSPFLFLSGKAALVLIVAAVLELWLMAVSCARTRLVERAVFFVVAIILAVGLSWALYFRFVEGVDTLFWTTVYERIERLGGLLVGSAFIDMWGILLVICLLSLLVIRYTADSLSCRETLVREADFWAEFKDHQTYMASIGTGGVTSWWGLRILTGVFSVVWLELVIAKKSMAAHLVQFIGIAAGLYYVLVHSPEWLEIGLFVTGAALLMNSYFSGLVRHLASGDVNIIPGALWLRIVLLEIANTIWILLLFGYGLFISWFVGRLGPDNGPIVVLSGGALYLLYVSIRLAGVAWSYQPTEGIPILRYYICILAASGLCGFFAGGVWRMFERTSYWLPPIALMLLAAGLWFLSYRKLLTKEA